VEHPAVSHFNVTFLPLPVHVRLFKKKTVRDKHSSLSCRSVNYCQ